MRAAGAAICVAVIAWPVMRAAEPPLAATRASGRSPAVTGLDHIPVAVADLQAASARYRALGFTLKPGTPHANGIRNVHAKFADGTEIELITAPEARDALTTTYRRHLEGGDGPAFVAFFSPAIAHAAERLDAAGEKYLRDRAYVDFPDDGPLHYVFLGPRNHSPTDRPEHFVHANTADALISVWLAGDDLSAERRLFTTLGATAERRRVQVPEPVTADVVRLDEGTIVFLPGARQLVSGRRIVGATVRARRVDALRAVLRESGLPSPAPLDTGDGVSVFLQPSMTHGLWLEFRQPR